MFILKGLLRSFRYPRVVLDWHQRCKLFHAESLSFFYNKGVRKGATGMTKAKGFSLIELLIVVAIILIIAAIAIPNLLRSRMLANQAAAVSTLRNINNSQASYIAEFTAQGYADNFVKLGPGLPCDATHACLVDDVIGCASQPCVKSGYGYFLVSTSTA